MTKIVINKCFGGFRLSDKALRWLITKKHWSITKYNKDGGCVDNKAQIVDTEEQGLFGRYDLLVSRDSQELRTNKDIIECVEKLGEEAGTRVSELKIVEVPDDVVWVIEEYDGLESVHETHRVWG